MPVSSDSAIVAGLGRNMGETVRIARVGEEEHAFFGGLELRKKKAQ